jgi:hypothetical protein
MQVEREVALVQKHQLLKEHTGYGFSKHRAPLHPVLFSSRSLAKRVFFEAGA